MADADDGYGDDFPDVDFVEYDDEFGGFDALLVEAGASGSR